jgi:hypothetical protein
LITRKQEGEALSPAEVGAALAESGIPVYTARVQRFRVAAFDAGKYLAYVISDLSNSENSQIAVALAPEVRQFLSRREG